MYPVYLSLKWWLSFLSGQTLTRNFKFNYWLNYHNKYTNPFINIQWIHKQALTSVFDFFDTFFHYHRDRCVPRLHHSRQIGTKQILHKLDVRQAVVWHFFWALLVSLKTTVWSKKERLHVLCIVSNSNCHYISINLV